MIFPDGPGACAVAAGAWLLVRLSNAGAPIGARAVIVVSSALATLPWLHTRFAVVAAGLGAAIVWRLWTAQPSTRADRLRRVLVFLAVPMVSAIGWLAYFQLIYGTPNPSAPYGAMAESSWLNVPGGLLRAALRPAVRAADLRAGAGRRLRRVPAAISRHLAHRRSESEGGMATLNRWCGGIVVAYLAISATYWMWWAGKPATPARLATAVLPLLAVPLASSWARASAAGRVVRMLLLLVIAGDLRRGHRHRSRSVRLERLRRPGAVARVAGAGRESAACACRASSGNWIRASARDGDPVLRSSCRLRWQSSPPRWSLAARCSAAAVSGRAVRARRVRRHAARARRTRSGRLVAQSDGRARSGALADCDARSLGPRRSRVSRSRPRRVAAAGDAASRLVITASRRASTNRPPPWGTWRDVPPGTYDARDPNRPSAARRPQFGRSARRLGRGGA